MDLTRAWHRTTMCECGHLRLHHNGRDSNGQCGFYTCTCMAFRWMMADRRAFAAIYIEPLVRAERLIEDRIRDLVEVAASSENPEIADLLVRMAQNLAQVRDLIVEAYVS